jgi:hypothetical protein
MGGYYYRAPNSSVFSKSFVIMLQGGGECVDEASCQDRTKQKLGSSKYFTSTMMLKGIQGQEPENNPDFGGFHMIFIPYCSGDLHTGQSVTPNNWGVHFSGHNIVQGVMEAVIRKYNMADAEEIIFSGESAGGIGAFANMDFVRGLVPKVKTFVGVPIGGFYFSNTFPYTGPGAKAYIPWNFTSLQTYYKLWDSFVPAACAAATDTPWECIFAVKSYKTLATNVFVVEAQTDKVVMPLHDGLPLQSPYPDPVLQYMQVWAGNMTSYLTELTDGGKGDGLFNPACLIHTGFKVAGPKIGGRNYLDALGDWLYKVGVVVAASAPPPRFPLSHRVSSHYLSSRYLSSRYLPFSLLSSGERRQ